MPKKDIKINLVSSLKEGCRLDHKNFTFNMTVAWFLRKALEKKGLQCTFVNDHEVSTAGNADHTIAISGVSMLMLRGTGRKGKAYSKAVKKKCRSYREAIRKTTSGKITIYLDADYRGWAEYFDHVFTVVKPRANASPKYVYAGWGADPEYCYPDQDEKAIFLDSLMYKYYGGRFNKIYDTYKNTLPTLGLKIYDPWPTYHGSVRLTWPQVQDILRKTHFHCCTQLGESGLTRIEAATCGALLVVPKPLYRPRTMASLEHRIWSTKQDLIKILQTETDPEAIRKKALAHSWDKVASRIIQTLEK